MTRLLLISALLLVTLPAAAAAAPEPVLFSALPEPDADQKLNIEIEVTPNLPITDATLTSVGGIAGGMISAQLPGLEGGAKLIMSQRPSETEGNVIVVAEMSGVPAAEVEDFYENMLVLLDGLSGQYGPLIGTLLGGAKFISMVPVISGGPTAAPAAPATTAAFGGCVDDADGEVAKQGATCGMLKNFGCDLELSTLDPSMDQGLRVKHVCPVSCDACDAPMVIDGPDAPPMIIDDSEMFGCEDDLTGEIAAAGLSCQQVVANMSCAGDLKVLGLPTGLLVKEICLRSCNMCDMPASGDGLPPMPSMMFDDDMTVEAVSLPPPNIVGDSRDENNCIPSAGYTWCEALQKCHRSWEEECVAVELVVEPEPKKETGGCEAALSFTVHSAKFKTQCLTLGKKGKKVSLAPCKNRDVQSFTVKGGQLVSEFGCVTSKMTLAKCSDPSTVLSVKEHNNFAYKLDLGKGKCVNAKTRKVVTSVKCGKALSQGFLLVPQI